MVSIGDLVFDEIAYVSYDVAMGSLVMVVVLFMAIVVLVLKKWGVFVVLVISHVLEIDWRFFFSGGGWGKKRRRRRK